MKISAIELKRRYYDNKNAELAKELGVTHWTLLRMLKRAGIKLKGKGNPKGKIPKYEIIK